MVKKISAEEFNKVEFGKVSVIDFSAGWCGPCKMFAPVVDEVAKELSDSVSIYNIDVDESPDLAEKFGVSSIPALVVLKDGVKVDMKVGFQPKNNLISYIRAQL